MQTSLKRRGKSTLPAVEVLNLSPFGFWLYVYEREVFLSFKNFPWFRQATVEQICNVICEHKDHLYWPDLDIDLDLQRIEHPEKYPLVSSI